VNGKYTYVPCEVATSSSEASCGSGTLCTALRRCLAAAALASVVGVVGGYGISVLCGDRIETMLPKGWRPWLRWRWQKNPLDNGTALALPQLSWPPWHEEDDIISAETWPWQRGWPGGSTGSGSSDVGGPRLRRHRSAKTSSAACRTDIHPGEVTGLAYAFSLKAIPSRVPHLAPVLRTLCNQEPLVPRLVVVTVAEYYPFLQAAEKRGGAELAERARLAFAEGCGMGQFGLDYGDLAELAGRTQLHVEVETHDAGPASKMLGAWVAMMEMRRRGVLCIGGVIICDDDGLYEPWIAQRYLKAHEQEVPVPKGSKDIVGHVLTFFRDKRVFNTCKIRWVQGVNSFFVPASLLDRLPRSCFENILRWAQADFQPTFYFDDYITSAFFHALVGESCVKSIYTGQEAFSVAEKSQLDELHDSPAIKRQQEVSQWLDRHIGSFAAQCNATHPLAMKHRSV